MTNLNSPPVPQFDRMIRSIVLWNAALAVAIMAGGFALTRSTSLVLGVLVGAILATVNAYLLAQKLKKITAMEDVKAGQMSMLGGMAVRFLLMGLGMGAAVVLLKLDAYGIAGLLGAILLFQFVSGWHASRVMMPK